MPDTFHLPAILTLIEDLQTQGRPEVVKKLVTKESMTDRLAATICGLKASLVETSDSVDARVWADLHR